MPVPVVPHGQYRSHPEVYYEEHINKIADAFDDEEHRIVAAFHDLGKLSDAFQRYIKEADEQRRRKLKTTHAFESAYLYFYADARRSLEFIANFLSIHLHHRSLPDFSRYIDHLPNLPFDTEEFYEKAAQIAGRAALDCPQDNEAFDDFFADEIDVRAFEGVESYFLIKSRFSRLILCDKFEAILHRPFAFEGLGATQIAQSLDTLHQLLETKKTSRDFAFRNDVRETVLKNYEANHSERIFLIKAPTGAGKTFAALELALTIARDKKKKRIITALPFTSIIDQTHDEYLNVFQEDQVLKYHHLTRYASKIDGELDEKEQFATKVFLADLWFSPVVVTTFNQLFFAIYSHQNRDLLKLEALRHSVIVIDEVQAISRSLLEPVARTMQFLAEQFDIHFVLMSATLPQIGNYLDTFALLSEDRFFMDKKSRYRLIFDETLNDFETLAQQLIERWRDGQSVLCVVNTVAKAKNLYRMVARQIGRATVHLLTTHHLPIHRKAKIETLKTSLNVDKTILISTQLIEAGVDLDFDCGFREFAPFASIIQSAGRINRENRGYVAECIVFPPLDNNEHPYLPIDLDKEQVFEFFKEATEENQLLPKIESYFRSVDAKTPPIPLLNEMKKLNFESTFFMFNRAFMPEQDWKVSLFVELEENSFSHFLERFEDERRASEGANKFSLSARLREIEKEMAQFEISVSRHLVEKLGDNTREQLGRYVLCAESSFYREDVGFTDEYSIFD